MDLISHTQAGDTAGGSNTRTSELAVAPVNLKVGVTNNIDFQIVLEWYNGVRVREHGSDEVRRTSGFGAATARVKVNLWGNDGGASAFGAISFVRWPSSLARPGNEAMEGGMVIPFALKLPGDWSVGAMTGFDFVQSETVARRYASFINSVTLGHALKGDLGGYVEFYSEVSAEPGSTWVGTTDFGISCALTANLQLDAGVNIGVTRAAKNLNLFTGLSWRF
jgi:hypothetical protein